MTTVDSEGYVRMFFMKKKGGYYGKEKTHIWLCGKDGTTYINAFKVMETSVG